MFQKWTQPAVMRSTEPPGGSLRAKGPCIRPTNAFASGRTFGAKHSLRAKGPCQRPTNVLDSMRTFGASHLDCLPCSFSQDLSTDQRLSPT